MIDRTTRLRWRRRYRRSRRQVEDLSLQAEDQLERHFFRRLSRLAEVRRFILTWILLMVLLSGLVVVQIRALSGYYQDLKPLPGGTFTEGLVGSFTNANPLYATGAVDATVARLVFAGLMKYDSRNQLIGDLAESIDVDERGATYTVKLRPGLVWHDGQPLTAADVVFTYRTIQQPDAKSPFRSSWQGITIEAIDDRSVRFSLPNALTAFPHSLTNGIVPKHLLETVPVTQLRSVRFNTAGPIGAGPFKWDTIEVRGETPEIREEQVGLTANERYHAGQPKIQHFTIRSFHSEERLLESFKDRELNAVSGLDSLPDTLQDDKSIVEHNVPLTGEVAVFFKTSQEILKDVKVRRALVQAADPLDIIRGLDYPVIAARGPLLDSHVGFDRTLGQLPTNIEQANKLLDEAGWPRSANGFRMKDGKTLGFDLYSVSSSQYAYVTQKLQEQWRNVGVEVEVILQSDTDFQMTVTSHGYDALLYGVSLGMDPDVYAYWHSSQVDLRSATRLNFSEYKSTAADQALEAGRTRVDPQLRAVKYRPFLQAWHDDAPALVLYQPRFLYVTRGPVYGFEPKSLNTATDRLNNVDNWMIREGKQNK